MEMQQTYTFYMVDFFVDIQVDSWHWKWKGIMVALGEGFMGQVTAYHVERTPLISIDFLLCL